jgi:hypothetical protein
MRILIAGFPHSGTSILRKIVGNHPEIFDYHEREIVAFRERNMLARLATTFTGRYRGRKNIVFKWPFHDVEHRTNADRIIYIIRNPFDVFGSLKLRFGTLLPDNHSPSAWQAYAQYFLSKPVSDRHFKIRYEDLFARDFAVLKQAMTWTGLDWRDEMLDTGSRYAPIQYNGDLPREEPPRVEHGAFRAWQTAQKLTDKTGQSRQHLDDGLKALFAAMPETGQLGYSADGKPAAEYVPRSIATAESAPAKSARRHSHPQGEHST